MVRLTPQSVQLAIVFVDELEFFARLVLWPVYICGQCILCYVPRCIQQS